MEMLKRLNLTLYEETVVDSSLFDKGQEWCGHSL